MTLLWLWPSIKLLFRYIKQPHLSDMMQYKLSRWSTYYTKWLFKVLSKTCSGPKENCLAKKKKYPFSLNRSGWWNRCGWIEPDIRGEIPETTYKRSKYCRYLRLVGLLENTLCVPSIPTVNNNQCIWLQPYRFNFLYENSELLKVKLVQATLATLNLNQMPPQTFFLLNNISFKECPITSLIDVRILINVSKKKFVASQEIHPQRRYGYTFSKEFIS